MCSLQSAYAPREALDPGEGEAVLGQALHDHSLPRDYPPPSLPTSRVVDFSRRLAVYVWSCHQAQPLHDHCLPQEYPRGETAALFAHEQSC